MALAVSHSLAGATAVVVPDDFATIQAGIDSQADTVRLRAGHYAEHPVLDLPVVLEGIPGEPRPRLDQLTLRQRSDALGARFWQVRRLEVTGPVEINPWQHNSTFSFVECGLGGGLSSNLLVEPHAIDLLQILDSEISGLLSVRAEDFQIERNTINGRLFLYTEFTVQVLDNWLTGGTGVAIEILDAGPSAGLIAHNRIENYDTGIYFHGEEGHVFEHNTIRGMSGPGIFLQGFDAIVRDNTIIDCGVGIESRVDIPTIHGNTILRAAGAGIDVIADYDPISLEFNVVGECGGPGITVHGNQDITLRRNTAFNNQGAGFVYDRASGILENNLGFGNQGWGVSVEGGGTLALACNDWFGNVLGSVDGAAPGATDLHVDPLFCDVENANVSLLDISPVLDAAGCGLIGALGLGCGATPTLLQMLVAESGNGFVTIRWRFGGLEWPSDFWVERAESSVGPWLRLPSSTAFEGNDLIHRDRAEPGTHWYRIGWTREGTTEHSGPVSATLPPGHEASFHVSPNPSFAGVTLDWSMPRAGRVNLRIYDLNGRSIATVASQTFGTGPQRSEWNGRLRDGTLAPAGWYVAKLRGQGFERTHRLLLIR